MIKKSYDCQEKIAQPDTTKRRKEGAVQKSEMQDGWMTDKTEDCLFTKL
jgi:hypothetical protein